MPKKKTAKKKVVKKKAAKKKVVSKKKQSKKKIQKKKKLPGRVCLLKQPRKDIQNKIVKSLKNGHWIETACSLAGISEAIFYKWRSRGEEELKLITDQLDAGVEDPEVNEDELIYVEFLEAVRGADAEAENSAVLAVQSAFSKKDKDWRAAMTFLERRFHKRWQKRDRTELTGPDGGPVGTVSANIDTSSMDADEATKMYLDMVKNVSSTE